MFRLHLSLTNKNDIFCKASSFLIYSSLSDIWTQVRFFFSVQGIFCSNNAVLTVWLFWIRCQSKTYANAKPSIDIFTLNLYTSKKDYCVFLAINSQKGASKFVNSHQPKKHNCKINKKQVLQAKEYLSVRLVSRGDQKTLRKGWVSQRNSVRINKRIRFNTNIIFLIQQMSED